MKTSWFNQCAGRRLLTPNDLWATIYRHLAIDYTHSFLDHSGRPMPILPFGGPICELI